MKICVVTAARSEYGLLRWIMEEIRKSELLQLQLVVTGAHLSPSQGMTVDAIKADGFEIDARVDMLLASENASAIAKSLGLCALGLAEVFEALKPDLLLILGDRSELLPICSVALVMGIPIAHLSGGDLTEGAIDDQVRHAVSKLSSIHFPGTEESAHRLRLMGEDNSRIHVVGEPGLDAFFRLKKLTRDELAKDLGLDSKKQWILLTWHPATRMDISQNVQTAQDIVTALQAETNIQVVITYANNDLGGAEINRFFEEWVASISSWAKIIKSLGQLRYISFMEQASLVVGNSSSGIVEAPMIGVRTVDIGDRQSGRHRCSTVKHCATGFNSIKTTISKAISDSRTNRLLESDNYYGDGQTAKRVGKILESYCGKDLGKKRFSA